MVKNMSKTTTTTTITIHIIRIGKTLSFKETTEKVSLNFFIVGFSSYFIWFINETSECTVLRVSLNGFKYASKIYILHFSGPLAFWWSHIYVVQLNCWCLSYWNNITQRHRKEMIDDIAAIVNGMKNLHQ